MVYLRSVLLAIAVWLSGVLAPAASAQMGMFSKDDRWGAIQVGQCFFVTFLGGRLELNWGGQNLQYSWSGACDAEGLIQGYGVLTTQFSLPPDQWNPGSSMHRLEMSGSATQGMFAGMTSEAHYSNEDDWNDATPPGSFQLRDGGDVRNPMPSFYQNGCSYYVGDNGAPDTSYSSFGCDEGGGQKLLDALRANDMSYFAGGENMASGAAAAPPAEEPASEGSVSSAVSAVAGVADGDGAPGTCAATEDESLAQFNADFGGLASRHPLPPKSADGLHPGARDTFQYSYFLGTEGLKLLEPYRACLGRHEAPNDAQLREMIDKGKKGCEQLSSSQGTCVPEYPF